MGSSDTSTLQVGIDWNTPHDTIGAFPLSDPYSNPGEAPTTTEFLPIVTNVYDSAYWNFPGIVTGNASEGLAFASPNAPESLFAVLVNSGLEADISLPSPGTTPAPEPSAVILLAAAAILLAIRRRLSCR
jgi:hypothetical protein